MVDGPGQMIAVEPGNIIHYITARTARDDIEYILRAWQARLNLSHWTIDIDWEGEIAEERCAEVVWSPYDKATVRFHAEFAQWSRTSMNNTIVHELVHLLLRDLQEGVESAENVLSSSAYKLFESRFEHELEGVVDRIALFFVEMAGEV